MAWKCSLCDVFYGINLKSVLNHINRVHRTTLNFSCQCPVPECSRKFRVYDNLYRHSKKDHKDLYNALDGRNAYRGEDLPQNQTVLDNLHLIHSGDDDEDDSLDDDDDHHQEEGADDDQ